MRKIQLLKSSLSYVQNTSLTHNMANNTSLTEAEQVLSQINGGDYGGLGYGGCCGYSSCCGGGYGYPYAQGCGSCGVPYEYYGCPVPTPYVYGGYYNAISGGYFGGYGPGGYGGYGGGY